MQDGERLERRHICETTWAELGMNCFSFCRRQSVAHGINGCVARVGRERMNNFPAANSTSYIMAVQWSLLHVVITRSRSLKYPAPLRSR